MLPTDVRNLILTFVRNTYRSMPETLTLATIKCAQRWYDGWSSARYNRHKTEVYRGCSHKILLQCGRRGCNGPGAKIRRLRKFGARLHSGAEEVHTIFSKYMLNNQFKNYLKYEYGYYLPDKPIFNMLKCWKTQTNFKRASERLDFMRNAIMATETYTLRQLGVPELHDQMFKLAMLHARNDMHAAGEETELLHPFYY